MIEEKKTTRFLSMIEDHAKKIEDLKLTDAEAEICRQDLIEGVKTIVDYVQENEDAEWWSGKRLIHNDEIRLGLSLHGPNQARTMFILIPKNDLHDLEIRLEINQELIAFEDKERCNTFILTSIYETIFGIIEKTQTDYVEMLEYLRGLPQKNRLEVRRIQ